MKYDGDTLHIMLDTEFLGGGSSPLVVSMGAAAFRMEGDGSETSLPQSPPCGGHYDGQACWGCEGWEPIPTEFYRIIDINDSFKAGLSADRNTLDWWFKSNAGQWPDQDKAVGLTKVAADFAHFYKVVKHNTCGKPLVWAHRAVYDALAIIGVLRGGYIQAPWLDSERDGRWGHVFRDTIGFYEAVGYQCHKPGTARHNALDDVKAQILEVQAAWRLAKEKGL